MDKKPLTYPPPDPPPNNELKTKYFTNYYYTILERVPGEYVKSVLTNYFRGSLAAQVIEYILENGAFTIPTLGYLFGAPRQSIDYTLKCLRPWVIQTREKLEHPLKGPGNRPYVWIRNGVDPQEGVNEARTSYYKTLEKYDPAIKRVKEEKKARVEAIAQAQTDRELLIAKVIERLGTPPEKSTLVYETMRELGLPQEHPDWLYVKNEVMRWMQENREVDS